MAQQPSAMLHGSTAISHASWLNSHQPCFMAQQPLAMLHGSTAISHASWLNSH
jgi:hypothetical protein